MVNFGNLLNIAIDIKNKKFYSHSEYVAPEQIEPPDDDVLLQSSEVWNIGVILYILYQGDYPFCGNSDEDILNKICALDNWNP